MNSEQNARKRATGKPPSGGKVGCPAAGAGVGVWGLGPHGGFPESRESPESPERPGVWGLGPHGAPSYWSYSSYWSYRAVQEVSPKP